MIELDCVSKVYCTTEGEVRALDDVTLRVNAGEFVAVRGPSGCGKSTLLVMIGGLGSPTAGRVVIDGADLARISASERARLRAERIGFVFQLFHLLPYVSVLDNVLVAAPPGKRAALQGRAREMLTQFGLAERLTHRPAELSIGERQRVAMARALLNRPSILLADEPTGNLDPDSKAAVLELVDDFHRAGGTVLLATHDAQAASHAQRSVQLARGRLVEADAAKAPEGASRTTSV